MPTRSLLPCADDSAHWQEWVTYEFRTAHSILRRLSSTLAVSVWISGAENIANELGIPAKQERE